MNTPPRFPILSALAVALAAASLAQPRVAQAAPITPGNLVMYRVGDGSNALGNTGNLVFLDEYTTAGLLVQSIAMPSTGGGTKLIAAGNSTSEGALSISPDGKWIAFTGYNSTLPYGSSLTSSANTAISRVVGILDTTTGNYTVTDLDTAAFNVASPRGAATTDGNKFWAVGGNTGVVYGTVDGSSPTVATGTTPTTAAIGTNLRTIGVFGNELYVSSASGALPTVGRLDVNPLANGLPTVNTALTGIPRQSDTPIKSRYAFTFLDLNPTVVGIDTMYVVDDSATSGGLWKYALDGSGNWNTAGSIGATTAALRGLTAGVDGSNVHLYMTGTSNTLWKYIDTAAATSSLTGNASAFTLLATAATSTAFRGVVLVGNTTSVGASASVPEAASATTPAIAAAFVTGLLRWRKGRSRERRV